MKPGIDQIQAVYAEFKKNVEQQLRKLIDL